MGLWLLYENQVQRGAIVHRRPLSLGVKNFYNHVDQIFESKAVITVREGGRILSFPNLVVDPRVLTHNVGRIQCRHNFQSWIIDARVTQLGKSIKCWLEYPI